MSLIPSRLIISKARAIQHFAAVSTANALPLLETSRFACATRSADMFLIGECAEGAAALAHLGKAIEEEGLSIHEPAGSALSAGAFNPQIFSYVATDCVLP